MQTGKSYVVCLLSLPYFWVWSICYLDQETLTLLLLKLSSWHVLWVELTSAWSGPCLSKDTKMGWHKAAVHLGDCLCVWVQFLISPCMGDLTVIVAPMWMKQASLIFMLCLFLGIPPPKIKKQNDITDNLQWCIGFAWCCRVKSCLQDWVLRLFLNE